MGTITTSEDSELVSANVFASIKGATAKINFGQDARKETNNFGLHGKSSKESSIKWKIFEVKKRVWMKVGMWCCGGYRLL